MVFGSMIFFCLVSLVGFMILSNATDISQNSIAIPSKESYRFVRSWSGDGSNGNDGQLNLPHSLAIDRSGNIYVTDTGNDRVEKFSPDGSIVSKWGSEGTGNGQFVQLHDINVSPDGKFVYTVELSNHRIQKFTSNGTFVTKWGYENTGGEGASRRPHQLALDSDGKIYLTDRANSEILVFDGNGKFLTKWGSKGAGVGQFIKPHGIVFNSEDQLYVTDMGNSRVQEFYKNGTFIRMWGSPGQEERGKFSDSIPGIAVDRLDNIYAIDRLQSIIQKFDGNGSFITMWGSKGSANGTMQKPEDLAINSLTGDVYVTDTENSRIQEFRQVNSTE